MIHENESEHKVIAIDPAREPSVTVITAKKGMFEFLYGIKKEDDFTPEMMEAIRTMMAERVLSYIERWSHRQDVSRMQRLSPNQRVQFLNVDYAEIEKRILAQMAAKGETLAELVR